MRSFVYRFIPKAGAAPVEGVVDAEDESDARRRLRLLFRTPRLPSDLHLRDQEVVAAEESRRRSAKLRRLLRIVSAHRSWLGGDADGSRADLAGEDLAGLDLGRVDLSHADLSDADMTQCGLAGAKLRSANLSRADLSGADLIGADLTDADLAEANLDSTDLTGAILDGANLSRASFHGCRIGPEQLHRALDCRRPEDL